MSTPEVRALFERQQKRRREAQARFTGRSLEYRLPPSDTTFIPVADMPAPPQLVVVSGADAGRAFDLSRGERIIGRAEGAAIQLTDIRVSHNHALLRVTGSQVTIEDLKSTNGTWVNGTLIEQQTPLASGDQIDVGGEQLLFLQEADQP